MFTLQTLPICDEEGWATDGPGNVAGFSLHAGVAVKAEPGISMTRPAGDTHGRALSERFLPPANRPIAFACASPERGPVPLVLGQANAGKNGAGGLFDWLRQGRIGRN